MADRYEESNESYLTGNEKLLARIRNRFDYVQDQWQDIRREAKTDMDYVSGNPWPASERKRREDAGRPCLVMDELNQYTNQLINDVRQNKRAVKVVPRGFGANDKTAELRGDLIREIEYKSNAQAAYTCAFENMCNRSYGGWVIRRRYINEKSFDQEIRICRIPNPDSSYPDPDCKEADFSDARYWFLLDLVPRREYKERYPKATITDFDSEHYRQATNWITEDSVQVAEYWEVELINRKLLLVKTPQGPEAMYEDELPQGRGDIVILRERETEQRKIKQYITNGIEILEENDEPGKYIPIIWGTGKELYVDDGNGPKRMLMSLVRLARDPQMLVNYYATCVAEVVGMTPKTPYIGVAGQFHNPDTWQSSITTPVAYLEYKVTVDGVAGPLPPPQRQEYEPQVQPLEIGKESARRSIQAAMGLSALPTNAQRLNDKSGIALKQIDDNEDRGTFHFIDNYEMMLEHSGRVINEMIPTVYDAPRTVGLRNGKDEHRTLLVNKETQDEHGNSVTHDLTVGEHEVTISTGQSFQSEREQANEFVKVLIPELEGMPIDPVVKSKLLALLVKTQNIGPMGDEIVELLDPKDQMQQNLAQLQQQVQQSQQIIVGLQTENQKLYAEKQGKVVDNEYMLKAKQMDNELKLAIAEITTKSQDATARAELTADLLGKLGVQMRQMAHEAALQAMQHSHERQQQEAQAAQAAQTQQSDQAHQSAMAA